MSPVFHQRSCQLFFNNVKKARDIHAYLWLVQTNIMTANFECLYFLDSDMFCIVEIKRTELPIYALKKDRFKWLMINKKTAVIKELRFQSMDSSHAIEERFFDLGYLKFDSEKGIFISKETQAQHHLENTAGNEIPSEIVTLIVKHLNSYENVVSDMQ
ncbi:hypothetical protein [Pedobacter heparinus]|uniref:hypothetical protein n=1 Tax=Pedobacter heparinus TaxID=984 RepID=UPI002931A446|nr:hypothetical protein [Pedobacter heparinus]